MNNKYYSCIKMHATNYNIDWCNIEDKFNIKEMNIE